MIQKIYIVQVKQECKIQKNHVDKSEAFFYNSKRYIFSTTTIQMTSNLRHFRCSARGTFFQSAK